MFRNWEGSNRSNTNWKRSKSPPKNESIDDQPFKRISKRINRHKKENENIVSNMKVESDNRNRSESINHNVLKPKGAMMINKKKTKTQSKLKIKRPKSRSRKRV